MALGGDFKYNEKALTGGRRAPTTFKYEDSAKDETVWVLNIGEGRGSN